MWTWSFTKLPTGSQLAIRRWYSAVRRSCSANGAALTPRQPSPRSAASSSVPGVVTVTHIGGCGSWNGLGMTLRAGISKRAPSQPKSSLVHIWGITRTNSSHVFLVSSGSAQNPPSSVHVLDRAVPSSKRPLEMMSSAAARSATRIGLFISGTHTTAPWPTRMRWVCAATAVRKTSGAGQCEYSSKKWCSTAQTWSNPSSSATRHCSSALWYVSHSLARLNGRGTDNS